MASEGRRDFVKYTFYKVSPEWGFREVAVVGAENGVVGSHGNAVGPREDAFAPGPQEITMAETAAGVGPRDLSDVNIAVAVDAYAVGGDELAGGLPFRFVAQTGQ